MLQERNIQAPEAAGVLTRAVLAAAERLGVSQSGLARILGVSEASISRLSGGRRIEPATKEGELALLFLRVYRSLDAMVGGDDEKARLWLHSENDPLAGIPYERLQMVEGLVDVAGYLDAMRGGR